MHRRALRSIAAKPRAAALVAGEPIVVTRNDYERGLFNGDQGVVVNVRDAGGRRFAAAVFSRDDGFAAFRIEALHDLIELAYATTVHKAQGSEFDVAALILPERDMPLLTRELLYTAVSRCRRGTVIVGDPALLALGISRKADRFSGLAEELNARAKPARPEKPMQLAMNFAQSSSERKRR
jgi:exodeoxyribonuclease V alpha subunit